MLTDDRVDGREAQPRPFARLLCGEKGLKEVSPDLFRHADAGVAHRQHHILAWRPDTVAPRVLVTDHDVGRADRHPATLRHGVDRIEQQVEQHLLHLIRVGTDPPQSRRGGDLQRDLRRQCVREQITEAIEQVVQVELTWRSRLASREGKELLAEPAGTLDIGQQPLQMLACRTGGRQQIGGKGGIATDCGEGVIKVMGHAPRQVADQLHLLRLQVLGLQTLGSRDVPNHDQPPWEPGWLP